MSPGTFETSTSKVKLKSEDGTSTLSEGAEFMEDAPDLENESVGDFVGRIATAQLDGKDTGEVPTIEASEKIIKHFNRKGLGGSDYFIYQGVKVYPLGKTEEIEERESVSADEKMHGVSGGTVVGR
jgi:hypothetical protein